jgi:Big-like domain-containing protein
LGIRSTLSNNINQINGDGNNDGMGLELHTLASSVITNLQKAYVSKVIDTVSDLDNVLYEIANESTAASKAWQYDMIEYIKSYEATKANRHPVLMSVSFDQNDSDLFASAADAIAPGTLGADYFNNPPSATGQKVIIADNDHINWTSNDPQFVWRNFMRGNNPVIFDWKLVPFDWNTGRIVTDDGSWDPMRKALGDTRTYADKMSLIAMTPQGNLSSTGYVLANPGHEYLVYRPGNGNVTVNLVSSTYTYEWFNPSTSSIMETGSFTAPSGNRSFRSPFTGQAVLYVKASEPPGPLMEVKPSVLNFAAVVGNVPAPKNAGLFNIGTSEANFAANTDQTWCHVLPVSGTVVVAGSTSVAVSVDAISTPSDLSCVVTLSDPAATNNPQQIAVSYSVTAPQDVTPPSVAITFPADGATVTRRTNVTITANASDNIGVTKVEFYLNNNLKCTDTAAPYSCLWSVPQAKATYSILAKVYDGAGNTSTSMISVTAE